jgi:hypothetical protein
MYNTGTMPRAITNDENSRSRRIQAQFVDKLPLTRAQYASHIVSFEDATGVSVLKANRKQLLRYLEGLSSKGVKRRGLQALRAYFEAVSREDDPLAGVTIKNIHRDAPTLPKLQAHLVRHGINERRVDRFTWSDLAVVSLRAKPFDSVPARCSSVAGHYLDDRIGGRRALRTLREQCDSQLSEE